VPTGEELERFARVAADYGYWLGSPSENAIIGISLFATAAVRSGG
jgi:hypothetical protein